MNGKPKFKGIEKKFNIEHEEFVIEKLEVKSGTLKENVQNDLAFIREKLLTSIYKGEMLLDRAIEIANGDIHPRYLDAASIILRTIAENSRELINLHKDQLLLNMKIKESEMEEKKESDSEDFNEPKKIYATLDDIIDRTRKKKEAVAA